MKEKERARKNNKRGFTLVETIVAFAIIAIIIVVALMSFNTIARINAKAQDMNIADEEMESKIALGDFEESKDVVLNVTVDPESLAPVKIEIPGKIQTYEHNGKYLEVFQAE